MISIHAIFSVVFLIFQYTSEATNQPTLDFIENLGRSMKYYEWTNLTAIEIMSPEHEDTWAWDETQHRLECCGILGPHDWDKLEFRQPSVPYLAYPKSCCDRPYVSEGISLCDYWTTYQIGCKERMEQMRVNMLTLFIIHIVIQLLLAYASHIYCLKKGELTKKEKNPADDIWTKFVSVQYNPTIHYSKARSKSCGVIMTPSLQRFAAV